MTFDASYTKRDLAFCVLIQAMQADAGSLFYEQFRGLKESCEESAQMLYNIYQGKVDLASTFDRSGLNIPSLSVQRQVILDFIEEKLNDKFPIHEQEIDPFLHKLRSKLFSEGYRLDAIKSSKDQIQLHPFTAVREGLEGNFGTTYDTYYAPRHYWFTETGRLNEEESRARFLQIKQEVETELGIVNNNSSNNSNNIISD